MKKLIVNILFALLLAGCVTVDPTPTPPTPTPDPTPAPTNAPVTGLYQGVMFYPHKLCGTTKTPPWSGNTGVDSLLGYVDIHGNSWEKDARRNGYTWIKEAGGDTAVFISEKLYGNAELQMFLTNRKHPQDGHRMNDAENEVVQARKLGVNRWIVALFNDDSTVLKMHNISRARLIMSRSLRLGFPILKASSHEPYIKEITGCYDWADKDQVAWLICLEANERFSVTEVIQRAEWVAKYSPGHRIIVGSANMDYLKQVAAAAKAKGGVIELWPETPWNPVEPGKANWDAYANEIADLLKTGMPVWDGERWQPDNAKSKEFTDKTKKMGVAGVGCGRFK
jgi:hypothetical protein